MGCASSAPAGYVEATNYPVQVHQTQAGTVGQGHPNEKVTVTLPKTPQNPPPQQQSAPPPPQQAQHAYPPPQPQNAYPPPQQQAARPPPGPPPRQPSQDEEASPEKVEITEALVASLLDLDQEIVLLESRNVFKQCQLKTDQLQRLDAQVDAMVKQHQQLDAQTKKEYQDMVNLQNNTSVRQMWSQQQLDQQMSKEQQDYMDALNQQEIHKKKLAALQQQQALLRTEVIPLTQDAEKLQTLYDKQDAILSNIFDGKYGSEAEFRLESELDLQMERKQRVAVARYKWKNSRTLLQHACGQLSFAIRRWGDVLQIPAQSSQIRYQFAAEARNNLVAAGQNITTAQRYLNTITFPYCTPDEIQTMNRAIANIFTDMMTSERHKHAMECYVTVYKRSVALTQWLDHVIDKTINKDIESATKECAAKQRQLKIERITLVQAKVREKLGDEVADKMDAQAAAAATDTSDNKEEPELALLVDADSVSQAGDLHDVESKDVAAPTPLGAEELAPTPAIDDIFGNIEELKKQHDEQVKEYERQQEITKARADQDLQSKLASRRSRRQRQAAQEAEMAALQGAPPY